MSLSTGDLRELIRSVVKEVLEERDGLEKLLETQEKHADHVCGCPDCYCDIIETMNKTSDYACGDCGLPLGDKAFAEKLEKCPNCGGKNAKKVER